MPRIVIFAPDKKPQPYRFPLDRKCTTIGRSPENDIVIDHPSISSFHAEMQRVKGSMILRDLESTNGIKLADEEMDVIELVPDIDVVLGDIPFEAQFSEEELEELEQEEGPSLQKAKAASLPPISKPKKQESKLKIDTTSGKEGPRPSPGPSPVMAANQGLSISTIILLAALAFFIGLAIRHYIETGEFILG